MFAASNANVASELKSSDAPHRMHAISKDQELTNVEHVSVCDVVGGGRRRKWRL